MGMTRSQFIDRMVAERKAIQPQIREADGCLAVLLQAGLYAWAEELANEVYGAAEMFEVRLVAHKGEKPISAIKFLREVNLRLGLKEAKDIVDRLRAPGGGDPHVARMCDDRNAADTLAGLFTEQGFDVIVKGIKAG